MRTGHRKVDKKEKKGKTDLARPFDQISGSKSNGTVIFEKSISEILVNLARLSRFPEIWNFQKLSVPLGISTRFNTRPSDARRLFFIAVYVSLSAMIS